MCLACGILVPYVCVLSHIQLFAAAWGVACQAPLSMGLYRQEYWSEMHFLLQEFSPIQGSNLHLLCVSCLDRWIFFFFFFFTTEPPGTPLVP